MDAIKIEKLKTSHNNGWTKMGARVFLVIMLLLIPFATLTPDPGTPSKAAPFLHFLGMAWVAFLACLSFETNRMRLGAVGFVFAYSALMEFFQHYLPYRNGTWEDVGINGLGCLMGVGLFIVQRSTFQVLNSRFRF